MAQREFATIDVVTLDKVTGGNKTDPGGKSDLDLSPGAQETLINQVQPFRVVKPASGRWGEDTH
jgi:hypothetical protein